MMAAGYALPLTASMKGVIPRASLSNSGHENVRCIAKKHNLWQRKVIYFTIENILSRKELP